MKTLSPTLLSKGKQLIVHDKLKTFCPLCKIRLPAPPHASPFSSLVNGEVLYFLHALQTQKKRSDIYWARVYLYSSSCFAICQLL